MMHDIAKGIGGLIIICMIVGFLDYNYHMPNALFGLVTGLLCYIVADFMQEEISMEILACISELSAGLWFMYKCYKDW